MGQVYDVWRLRFQEYEFWAIQVQSREETLHAYWKHPVKGVAGFRNVMLRREEKGMSVSCCSVNYAM